MEFEEKEKRNSRFEQKEDERRIKERREKERERGRETFDVGCSLTESVCRSERNDCFT